MNSANHENNGGNEKLSEQPKKGFPRWLKLALIVIAILALIAAVASYVGGSSEPIVLPDGTVQQEAVSEEQEFTLTDADIDLNNVRQVIDELERPKAYTTSIDNTVYWAEDWSIRQVRQYVRDGVCLTEYLNTKQDVSRYEMIVGQNYYSWRVGATKYYTGLTGTVTADQSAMIPTYESIVETKPKNILDAGIRNIGGVPCIYCRVLDKKSGYTIDYYVSTVTGLLARAEYTKDGSLVRSVAMTVLDQSEPDEELFVLPDGRNALEMEKIEEWNESNNADDLLEPAG